jgi:outer membrane receptor protein involved in Fe transport
MRVADILAGADDSRMALTSRWLTVAVLAAGTAGHCWAQDYMALSLEELMQVDVAVASRVSRSVDRQPVSVSVIDQAQIRGSGARTLAELLMLHVPGFFLVEDQDDSISAVRGMAPDNNSKLMLMLDGRSLNADWFWGPPDALLNGLDLEFIERVEVIRGPGSVTQGQGALLGVINLVTRAEASVALRRLSLVGGEQGRRGAAWRWRSGPERAWQAALYLADGEFEGQPYRDEGLGLQVEQGLSVFERNHHLKRGSYQHLLADLARGLWQLRLFRFEQRRDLYNWRRDRERVGQQLSGAQLAWRGQWGGGELALDLHHQIDDYALATHGGTRPEAARQIIPGLVLGGHRETRSGARLLWTSERLFEGHRLALGGEWNRFASGRANADGNNFIVNFQERTLEDGLALLNQQNRWVIPATHALRSLFVEDFITLAEGWELFAAARWDSHPNWGSELTPRLGLMWDQSPASRWRLSWQSGFRGAVGVNYSGGFEGDGLLREANFSAVEDNPFFAANGNRNLDPVRPEKMSSLELAWSYLPGAHWRFNAVGFYNITRNVIGVGAYFIGDDAARAEAIATRTRIGSDRIGDWGGVFYFQNNDGSLHHRGLELEIEYRREDLGLLLRASHAHVRVAEADPGQFGPGNIYVAGSPEAPLSRSFPEDVSRLHLVWRPRLWDGQIGLQLTLLSYPHWYPPVQVSPQGIEFTPRLQGNSVLNLGLSWQPPSLPGWSLWAQAKNIGNADALYPAASVAGEGEGNLGVPGLERRSAWVTVRYEF